MSTLYPGAIWRPSTIKHPPRPGTYGIVIHWTAGHEPGDLQALDGPSVDVQFYVTKAGKVYQFLDVDSQAWHAFHTANTYCIGIEHEGSGEPWTDLQLAASAKLAAWLCHRYYIPIKHAQPRGTDLSTFHGLMGHGDLSAGHVDQNDHTDTVPSDPGWNRYLNAVQAAYSTDATKKPAKKPTLRQRLIAGFLKAGFGGKSAVKAANKYLKEK